MDEPKPEGAQDAQRQEDGFYTAPPEMWIMKEGETLPQGYVLLAEGDELHADAKSEDYAKWRLSKLCRACGANAITRASTSQFVRNSIGFSFYMNRVKGRPALIAKPGSGTLSYADVMGGFSKERSSQIAARLRTQKGGNRMLFVSGAVLLVLCVIGFILSGGV
ncbi:MAG: hypothetical protein ACI4NA_01535 [Succinivibrio sp.]